MFNSDRALTASRSELRDTTSSAARSASLGSRSPARSVPETIMALIFSIASSVTATQGPPFPRFDCSITTNAQHAGGHEPPPSGRLRTVDRETDLHMLNLVVRDMGASLDFYRRLGVADDEPASGGHLQLRMPGGVSLEMDTAEMPG